MEEDKFRSACTLGYVKTVREILGNNPDFNINFDSDWTCLHCASYYGYDAVVARLLAHPGLDVNRTCGCGETAFYYACERGRLGCFRLLLKDARVEVNQAEPILPLAAIAARGRSDFLRWMIASGRELRGPPEGGLLALMRDPEGENTRQGQIEVNFLLQSFVEDEASTREAARREIGYYDDLAGDLFALVIFLCDGLLVIGPGEKEGARRFFGIARQLPMELQKVLCHRTAGSGGNSIPAAKTEAAFRELAWKVL